MSFCNNCKKRVEKTKTLYGECYLEGELQFQDSFELCKECEKLFIQYGNYDFLLKLSRGEEIKNKQEYPDF